ACGRYIGHGRPVQSARLEDEVKVGGQIPPVHFSNIAHASRYFCTLDVEFYGGSQVQSEPPGRLFFNRHARHRRREWLMPPFSLQQHIAFGQVLLKRQHVLPREIPSVFALVIILRTNLPAIERGQARPHERRERGMSVTPFGQEILERSVLVRLDIDEEEGGRVGWRVFTDLR